MTNMSTMTKSHWTSDGNTIRLSMPFTKIDKENRLVSGYATLDNLDSQGDVVLAEASQKAFARARGNIREMHQPIAAGRIVDFRDDEFYDTDTQKFYRGIYVTAYVSKGAQTTWEKVLDGTLTGFSIGGNITDSSTEFVKEADAQVRFIKEYDLVELSLVDNPANHLANVFSIQKASDGSVTIKGMIAETSVEGIFWCETDNVARTSDADAVVCPNCESQMNNIGWVESGAQKEEKVREVVAKFLGARTDPEAVKDANGEGGVDVKLRKSEDSVEPGQVVAGVDETTTDELESAEAPDAGTPAEDSDDQSQDYEDGEVVPGVDEVDADDDVSKKLDALHEAVTKSLDETKKAATEAVAAVEQKVDALAKTFEEKTSEFNDKFNELGKNLDSAKASVAELEKSLITLNDAEAIKKSADGATVAEPKQKENLWGGAFSVDNLIR